MDVHWHTCTALDEQLVLVFCPPVPQPKAGWPQVASKEYMIIFQASWLEWSGMLQHALGHRCVGSRPASSSFPLVPGSHCGTRLPPLALPLSSDAAAALLAQPSSSNSAPQVSSKDTPASPA